MVFLHNLVEKGNGLRLAYRILFFRDIFDQRLNIIIKLDGWNDCI